MTAENRVLALQLAIDTVVPDGGGFPANQGSDVTTVATLYYRWLEGPAFLFLTVDPTTFDQAAPEGPGTPTVRKGNTVQLIDRQQVTLNVGEQDSEQQPVTGDQLAWTVDNANVITITPSADGYSCLCASTVGLGIPGGTIGDATVSLADNTVTPPLTGSFQFSVVSGDAASLTITAGTPEDIPPAA